MDYLPRLIAALLFFAAGLSFSQTGSSASVNPPRLNTLQGTADFERFMRNVTGDGADVVDRFTGRVGTQPFTGEATRRITRQSAVKAFVRNGAKMVAGGAAVAGAAMIAQEAWCKFGDTGGNLGRLLCNVPQEPELDKGYGVYVAGEPATYAEAFTIEAAVVQSLRKKFVSETFRAGYSATTYSDPVMLPLPSTWTPESTGGSVRGRVKRNSFNWDGNTRRHVYSGYDYVETGGVFSRPTTRLCPAVVNFFDPAYTVYGAPPAPDGKCPSNVYSDLGETETAAKLEPKLANSDKVQNLIETLLRQGVDLNPYAEPQKLTGPQSVQGPVTTQQGPNGVTSTQNTYNIKYGDNYYTWTTVTTTTNPDGSQTTETKEDKPSECEINPNSASCMTADTPQGPEIIKEEKMINWEPQSGWGADSGSCPAPPTISLLGQSMTLPNDLFCQFFSGIRFAVIGFSAIMGAFIFIGGLRE